MRGKQYGPYARNQAPERLRCVHVQDLRRALREPDCQAPRPDQLVGSPGPAVSRDYGGPRERSNTGPVRRLRGTDVRILLLTNYRGSMAAASPYRKHARRIRVDGSARLLGEVVRYRGWESNFIGLGRLHARWVVTEQHVGDQIRVAAAPAEGGVGRLPVSSFPRHSARGQRVSAAMNGIAVPDEP